MKQSYSDNTFPDIRQKRSERALKLAFSQLLKEKTFEKIFVTDIYKRAEYSSVAFYSNYTDKFDLAKHLISDEAELHARRQIYYLEKQYANNNHSFDTYRYHVDISYDLFHHVEKNRQIYEAIFKGNIADNPLTAFSNQSAKSASKRIKLGRSYTEEYNQLLWNISVIVVLSHVLYWIDNDYSIPIGKMVDLIADFFSRSGSRASLIHKEDNIFCLD